MNKLATILLCINFITVLFPQPGYIHPDEFFQSVEVVAGDVLNVSHYRAWEFTESFPLRSIVFPYVLTAPPLHLLKVLNLTGWHGLHISTVKVVMSTRLPIAFLSVFGYLATGRLADSFGVDRYLSTVLYCSSYVAWTYYTRTFSNSVESILLAMLFIFTFSGSATVFRKNDKPSAKLPHGENDKDLSRHDTRESKDQAIAKEQKEDADQESQKNQSVCSSYLLGSIVTAGIFNRPTFVLFAFVPVLFWFLERTSLTKPGWLKRIIKECSGFVFGVLFTSAIFIVLDTTYHRPWFFQDVKEFLMLLSSGEMSTTLLSEQLKDLASSLVITPLNFVIYNTDTTNLAEHGLHPRVLHFFVNLPLLLGPVYIPFIFLTALALFRIVFRSSGNGDNPSTQQHLHWLILMALVPVLCLSVFPHQEPRFLIPALPLFMVMGAKVVSAMAPAKLSFLALWVVFNILMTLAYGYLHQGALIPAMSIYQQKLATVHSKSGPIASHHTAIFYKTYPPPRHLLLLPSWTSSHIDVLDLAGAPVSDLQAAIQSSRLKCRQSWGSASSNKGAGCYIYLFMPATVSPWVTERLSTSYKMQTSSICPHLSMEAPPRLMAWWRGKIALDEFLMEFCLNIVKIT